MARGNNWRVYIKPFDDYGAYTEYVEVTEDVDAESIGSIERDLDNADFNIGVYRVNNLSITFRNDRGKYSDVGGARSIFKYTRTNSLLKITWSADTGSNKAGWIVAGNTVLAPETDVFIGLINSDGLSTSLDSRKISFPVLGREATLKSELFPIAALNGGVRSGSISTVFNTTTNTFDDPSSLFTGIAANIPVYFESSDFILPSPLVQDRRYYVGPVFSTSSFQISETIGGPAIDLAPFVGGAFYSVYFLPISMASAVILACLNQPKITAQLTVSALNINVGFDFPIYDPTELQGKTVWDAMSDLLLLTNSIFYVNGDSIIISSRTVGAALVYTFFGQDSLSGVENIIDIKNIKDGVARTFNYLVWNSSLRVIKNTESVAKYGTRTKDFSQTLAKFSSDQDAIMTSILSEFGMPKKEMEVHTALNYATLAIKVLDKVSLDYPPPIITGQDEIPIYGTAICGVAICPDAVWNFVSVPEDTYKVTGKSIDIKNGVVRLRLRGVT